MVDIAGFADHSIFIGGVLTCHWNPDRKHLYAIKGYSALDSLDVFKEFYDVIESIKGTIDYQLPTDRKDLLKYDVIVADFCEIRLDKLSVDLLDEYIRKGGSIIVLGDSFYSTCINFIKILFSYDIFTPAN